MSGTDSPNAPTSRDAVIGVRRVVLAALALAALFELGAKFSLQFGLLTAPAADLLTVAAVLALGLSGLYALHRVYRSRVITVTVLLGLGLLLTSQMVEIAGDLNAFGLGDLHFGGAAVFKMIMNTSFIFGLGAILTALYLSIFQSLHTKILLERERAEVFREAAEREAAEAQLLESQKRLRTIFDGLEDTLFVHDLDGRILDCNRAACEVLGYTRDELLSMRTVDFDEPEFGKGFQERIAHQLRDGSYRCVGEIRKKDGGSISVDIHTTKIDFQGKPAILALNRDISDQVRAEEERRLMEEKMQHTQKLESLGVLAGGIAHDFNNLLMGVLGNANLARLELGDESPASECLVQIEIAAQRAADLSKQMLAYSGKARMVAELVDLGELVDEMAHLLASSISKSATLIFRIGEDLPAIYADPTQVRQVVMNLITNASDALGTEPGTIELTTGAVEVGEREHVESYFADEITPGRYVYVEATDTGTGMDRATLERIFDPFFTTKFTGRGLGLASVVGIIQGHGGTIQVHTEVGYGSTFRVLFPAADANASPKASRPAPKVSSMQTGTVLIIDDEESVLSVTKRTLELVGYKALIANDGLAGLDAFRANSDRIGLVVLDWTMPRMNGLEVLRAIRSIQPAVPVILSSGYSETDTLDQCRELFPAAFIQKPYLATELIDLVHDTLAGGPANQSLE
jgi:PAS domain S-box-containing protein